MSSARIVLASLMAVALVESGCGDRPVLVNAVAPPPDIRNMQTTDMRLQGGILGTLGVELPKVCMIHHRHKWTDTGVITGGPPAVPDTVFVGPDGNPQRISREQCDQENARSLAAEEDAFQKTVAEAQRAAQQVQQKQTAAAAQVVRDEAALGYKHVTVRDLLLDGRTYASDGTKVAAAGFYKLNARRDERLYISYDDFMMHTFQPVEARYVGLLTDGGSRALREYLMRCVAGCNVTILGHLDRCVETNVFGAKAQDVCLVADDIKPPVN